MSSRLAMTNSTYTWKLCVQEGDPNLKIFSYNLDENVKVRLEWVLHTAESLVVHKWNLN